MFNIIFWALFRHVGVPVILLVVFWDQFGNPEVTFAVVNVILTFSTAIAVIWHLIKLIPNLALLRKKKLTSLVVELVIEIGAVIGFWFVFWLRFYAN